MLITVTRFFEAVDARWHVQRVIDIPFAPPVGTVLDGLTALPCNDLVVHKLVWDHPAGVLHVLLKPKFPDAVSEGHLRSVYGPDWTYAGPTPQCRTIRNELMAEAMAK